ncbi:MAG: response regulator, partial [Deltaproteobacteria bacterium]|nr:response regulator [Deltaproteobacteria bacterium]
MNETHEKKEKVLPYIKSSFKIILAVADDNLADTFMNALNPFGYYTVRVHSGKDALQAIETTKPDLIICDVDMPEMSGLLLLRTIKKDPSLADIPFVLITAPENMNEKLRGG